ncbi:probable phosphoglycerate mutase [Pedococcus dokdonensis]|uniref:Probable phosphoglycerate mutase n=1 Tax=Pedococcus dokdonensis TaxID=443156 RepID=A0A1H0LH68_9MICO|nr:histidine phosphatase family protein [Pedococcus dokdonensis]SDO67567.1 probable phosphoglycerate mutase [Pedococcus dokdonensis]
MSDLQCAATLLIARHGDAEYGHPSVLSDEGGWLSAKGIDQTLTLAQSLADRRVAAVRTSVLGRAVQSGAVAAEVLGVNAEAVEGLEEFSVGALAGRPHDDPELQSIFMAWVHGDLRRRIPGGVNGEEVLGAYREALQSIADQFRGETVLVFSHGGVMSFVLPRIAGNLRDDLAAAKFLPNCAVAEVAVDGDGFEVRSWPGSTDRTVV